MRKTIAIIVTGGIGDAIYGLQAASLLKDFDIDIYVNSHQEILDFISKCTKFTAFPCPERSQRLPEEENPLNLPPDFLDALYAKYERIYACHPDGLGFNPFAFPWYQYVKNYKEFLRTKIALDVPSDLATESILKEKNIFCNFTSVTPQKNWPLTYVQKFVERMTLANYNVIIARTSQWKGTSIPFFCTGKFYDLVDAPIKKVLSIMNRCDYFVGIDSGLAHCAFQLGLPRIVMQRHFHEPFHMVRWQEDTSDCVPLDINPDVVADKTILGIREPVTQNIPAYLHVPSNINTKQLLIKKYYA